MGETALVERKIEEIILLIKQLDEDGNSPSLVSWYFYADVEEWKLLIAGPTYDKFLPKHEPNAYRNVIESMTKLPLETLSVSDIKIITTSSPVSQAISILVRTEPTGISQAHFIDTTLNGIFIKEMVIIRSA